MKNKETTKKKPTKNPLRKALSQANVPKVSLTTTQRKIALVAQTHFSGIANTHFHIHRQLMDTDIVDENGQIIGQKPLNPYQLHTINAIQPKTFYSRALGFNTCGKDIITTWHNGVEIPHAFTCKNRACFHCNSVKAKKRTLTFIQGISDLVLNNQISMQNLRLMMITLSPKNGDLEQLNNMVRALREHVKHMMKVKRNGFKDRFAPKGVFGHIMGVEFVGDSFNTQLAVGKCHPHVHILLVVDWDYYTKPIPPKPSKAKRPPKKPKPPKSRYLTSFELSEMFAKELKRGMVVGDHNDKEYNTQLWLDKEARTKTARNPVKVQLEGNNVDMRIVFDGRKFANKYAKRSKERAEKNLHSALHEILKGFKLEASQEETDPQEPTPEQIAKDFTRELEKETKDAVGYPDSGADSPEQLRLLGMQDYKNQRQYEKDGTPFKPLSLIYAEQQKGLRSFSSGGSLAKCKLRPLETINTPPERAQIYHNCGVKAQGIKLRGKADRDKRLDAYLIEQGALECEASDIITDFKHQELGIYEQAHGVELGGAWKALVDRAVSESEEKTLLDKVLDYLQRAFDPCGKGTFGTFKERRENGGFIPYKDPLWKELEENTPYNYRMWLIAKMCYAYALDTYTSGDESIFLHDEVVDQAIKKALKISDDSDDDDVPTPLDTKQRKALLSEISELVALSLPDEPDDLERQEQELEELIAEQQRRQGLVAPPPKDEQPPQDEQQANELIALSLPSDECVPTDYDPNIFGDLQETYIPDDYQTPDEVQEQQTQELIANDDPQETFIPDDWQTPDDACSDVAFAMCEALPDETNLHFT
ncbi:protein rep [Helicobacter ailurogastricus]|uniref:protein rep n=1 Tax=Helicobacter ailurogastricus TaxID=1578720 RepID=UPI00255736FF|nr:protein rep [Helicobacter ailurogastricus]